MSERVDYPPRARKAIDELMCKKDATDNRMSELIGILTWFRRTDDGELVIDHSENLITCRDCQYCDEERSLCCKWFDWIPVEPDGFCKWGEPK